MGEYFYNAFISYRHVQPDKAVAIKLQKLLETYRPPKNGHYKNASRIKRIFRDESELPTSGDLGADIKKALSQSAYLIVICSTKTAESAWCLQEIEYFKQLHNGNNENIITLLVNGNPKEVFPKELCYETRISELEDGGQVSQVVEVEPLAANIIDKDGQTSLRKLKTEFLRIAAPILGCSFDDLYRRHQRRLIRNIVVSAAAVTIFLLLFTSYVFAQSLRISQQSKELTKKQTLLETAYQNLTKTNDELKNTNKKLDQQITETTSAKELAEANRQKAEEQTVIANEQKTVAEKNAKLAMEQKALAESNLFLANQQTALAKANLALANQQTALALANEKKTKEQQLFRTINYAKQLSLAGDKIQAAAILAESYTRFDSKSPLFDDFKAQIETVMAQNTYTPAYSVYAKLTQDGWVTDAAFSEDGLRAATAADDKTVIIWDVKSGKKLHTLLHDYPVNKVCFYKGYLITGTLGGTVSVYEVKSGKLLHSDKETDGLIEQSYINSNYNQYIFDYYGVVSLSYNEKIDAIVYCIKGTKQNRLTILPFSTKAGKPHFKKQQNFYFTSKFSISKSGSFLCYMKDGVIDQITRINKFGASLSQKQNEKNMNYQTNISYLYYVDVSIDDNGFLYYATKKIDDVKYHIYNTVNKTMISDVEPPEYSASNLKFNPNSLSCNRFVMDDGYVAYFYDLNKSRAYSGYNCEFDFADTSGLEAYYIPDSDNVLLTLSGNEDTTYVYSLEGVRLAKLNAFNAPISAVAISPDGKTIITAAKNGQIYLHTAKASLLPESGKTGAIQVNGLTNQYKTINGLNYYDITTGKVLATLKLSDSTHELLSFCGANEGGSRLLGVEGNYKNKEIAIHLWDAKTGKIADYLKPINKLLTSYESLNVCAASPDFSHIAALINHTVYVFSTKDGAMIHSYDIYEENASLCVSNDGRFVSILGKNSGILRTIDLKKKSVLLEKTIKYYGSSIQRAYMNLEDNRIIICANIATDISTNCEVYSLSTGEKLLSFSDMEPQAYEWTCSNDTTCAVSQTGKKYETWHIPSFEEIVKDNALLSKGYVLNEEERQLCGLNMFDN